ncbi:MAG: sulfatase-like hydrolase/transferase [Phycisphaera sp.]|nr:sulfatase-like hydrolase/transferase [Phycisphaera sp.]
MPKRPNFILLVGEDAGRFAGCYGDPLAYTPNLDRLASEGCRFDNAFSTAPVCAPSRSTLVSGRYAWSLGSHHMRSTLVKPPRLFTHALRDAGYHVSWPTKLDFNFEPDKDYCDDTQEWEERLRSGAFGDRPFFVYKNFGITHESTMWATAGDHKGQRADREEMLKGVPANKLTQPADVRVPAYLADTPEAPEIREDIARFYDALSLMDAQAGQVLDALGASPCRDNTVVIFLTDHGRGLLREKRWCYDAGVHLSLIVRWPNGIEAGTVSDRMVSWVDIGPTVLSLAGVEIPGDFQGSAFLGDADDSLREFVFAGRDRMDETFDRVRMARDKRWHYLRNFYPELPYAQRNRYMEHQLTTRAMRRLNAEGKLTGASACYFPPTKPPEELYDAHNDPDMVNNLADDPSCKAHLERLRAALDEELERFGDLGQTPERELIARSLVVNRLDNEYRPRIEPLPEGLNIGKYPLTVLEESEL